MLRKTDNLIPRYYQRHTELLRTKGAYECGGQESTRDMGMFPTKVLPTMYHAAKVRKTFLKTIYHESFVYLITKYLGSTQKLPNC